jgi:Na+/melibiose symporter-like transporter
MRFASLFNLFILFKQVAGSRFAWATRNVHITALNDSKYVGMSLYNVVLLSTTTAVVGYFLQDQHERSYILTSVFILLCVTITLCLVFVPKVREVAKDPRSIAKPQRAVISNVAKLSQDKGDEGKLLRDDKQQFILRLKLLTNQNNILRSNSVKVCIRSK